MRIGHTLYVRNRRQFRRWLRANHARKSEIWLIYYKRHTGRERIPYDDAVEEALCFGWIDSTVKRLDVSRYAQRFTPRKPGSVWSRLNLVRVRKMIRAGRMTKVGLEKARPVLAGREKAEEGSRIPPAKMPSWAARAIRKNPRACTNYRNMAPSYRKMYAWWLASARKADTRERRLRRVIRALERNSRP